MNASRIYEKFAKLERLLKRVQMQAGTMEGRHHMDSFRGQGRVIAALMMKDGISTKELSYILDIAPPSLNEMLAKLAKVGYVERKSAEDDKRIILNYVTEAGKQAYEQGDSEELHFLDCLTPEEQTTLDEYLDRIIANLEEKTAQRQDSMQSPEPEDPMEWGRPRRGRGPKPKMFAPMGMRPPKPKRPMPPKE